MEHIRGSIIDGRVENVRYRQNQLHQLHASLRTSADEICEAISRDAPFSKEAAEREFFLAMDSINKAYETLDFDRVLKEEYLIKEQKDNLLRRTGLGLIAIRPGTHSRFYSIVNPLAMAIAAGNCVYLEIQNPNLAGDKVLKEILPKALDRDLFAISLKFTDAEISKADLFLDGTNLEHEKDSKFPGGSTTRTLAVIDRSADIRNAAKDIVNSRVSGNESSPYSPDLVIVNEYVQAEFIKYCEEFAAQMNMGKTAAKGTLSSPQVDIVRAEKAGQVKTSKSTKSELTIVEIKDKSCALATGKISGQYLVILPSTSVTDTITSQLNTPEKICTYIYAQPSTAKFISEQIASVVTYVNQIPQQLLFGPISSPHSLHPRYTTTMFSTSRPTIIEPVPTLPTSTENLKDKAVVPLKPTGQKMGHAIGFFEQGILLGLSITAFVVLPLGGMFVWTAAKRAWALLK